MTSTKLASLIAKREGKKSQVSIGNVREVLRILGDMMFDKKDAKHVTRWLKAEIARREKKAAGKAKR